MIEARIVGLLMTHGGWPSEEHRIRATVLFNARKRTDTAMVTLAVEKVVYIPIRSPWADYLRSSYDGKTYYLDIESWNQYPSGMFAGNPQMQTYINAFNAKVKKTQDYALMYGEPDRDYQKFNKRKR